MAKRVVLVRWLLLLGLFGCFLAPKSLSTHVSAQDNPSVSAGDLDPTFVQQWMQLLYDRVQAKAVSAPAASRLYAYAGITAYQAALPGMSDATSLAGQLQQMPDTPYIEDNAQYDWVTSETGALSTLIQGLFAADDTDTHSAVTDLRKTQSAVREKEVGKDIVQRSLKYGDSVGQAILDWAGTDNFKETRGKAYEIPTGDPAYWVLTNPNNPPVEPYWGTLRTFAMSYADQCAVPFNEKFSTDPQSTFYLQALEVAKTGDKLTDEQKLIARFWVDTPGQTGTPAGHWVLIENQIVDKFDLKLNRAVEMYARVGMALGDSFISAWSLKYQVLLLRPETYIQQYIRRSWKPYIASPSFPEYPSGHSVVSSAAAEVLTWMFGTVAFTDQSGVKRNLPPRSFTSFQAAASEAAISRMYGGIHFRAAIENGLREGQCIGNTANNNILTRSIPQGE